MHVAKWLVLRGWMNYFKEKDLEDVFDWAKRLRMVVKVREHDMKIKFSKFQDLICVVKTRSTSKGDWTLHHLIGNH